MRVIKAYLSCGPLRSSLRALSGLQHQRCGYRDKSSRQRIGEPRMRYGGINTNESIYQHINLPALLLLWWDLPYQQKEERPSSSLSTIQYRYIYSYKCIYLTLQNYTTPTSLYQQPSQVNQCQLVLHRLNLQKDTIVTEKMKQITTDLAVREIDVNVSERETETEIDVTGTDIDGDLGEQYIQNVVIAIHQL